MAPPPRGNPGSATEIVQLVLSNYFRSNGRTATKIVQFSFLFSQRKTQYKFEAGEENRIELALPRIPVLGADYNEFGYYEQPATTSNFFAAKNISD